MIIISNRKDLSNGVTEEFRKAGFETFGITKEVAKLETVKEYAKRFMVRNNINTPEYYVTDDEMMQLNIFKKIGIKHNMDMYLK